MLIPLSANKEFSCCKDDVWGVDKSVEKDTVSLASPTSCTTLIL